jgi:non-heme chloroperoxidase
VARYFGKYGSKGVSKAVFISSVPPFLLKTPDNPEGVDGSVFEGIQKAVAADRYAFFTEFFKNFYNTDLLLGKRVSEQAIQANWNVTASASATASLACVPRLMPAWQQMAGPPTAVALYQLLPSGLSSNRAEFPS